MGERPAADDELRARLIEVAERQWHYNAPGGPHWVIAALWPLIAAQCQLNHDEAKKQEREESSDLLKRCADGRREYMIPPDKDGLPDHIKAMNRDMEVEALTLDAAARVALEGEEACYGLLPSWRWSKEMNDRLFARGEG